MNFLVLMFILLGAHSAVSKTTTDDCSAEMDLCFVVDSSRSICYKDPHFRRDEDSTCPNWNALLSFIHSFVARMDIGENAIRVGLVVFDCEASVRWDLTRYRNRKPLMAAIEQLEYTPGQANTSGGLDVSRMFVFDRSRGQRPYATNVAVIITDGRATDPTAVQPAIDRLHADDVTTYAVGVSDAIDEESLKQLASEPKQNGKRYWKVADFDQLDQVLGAVQNQVCDDASSAAPPPGSSSFASSLVTRRDSRESTTAATEKSSSLTATKYLPKTTAQPKTTTQATATETTPRLVTTTPELTKTKKTTVSMTKTTPESTKTEKTTVSMTKTTPEPTETKKTTVSMTKTTPEPGATKKTTVSNTKTTREPTETKKATVSMTKTTPKSTATKKTTVSMTKTTPEPTITKTTTVPTTTTTPKPTTTTKTTTELVITTAEPTTVTTEWPKCDPSLSSSSQNLTNTVVYEGAPATFFRINNCRGVQWQLTASSSFYNQARNITYYDDDVGEAFIDMVAVSGSQLTVFESTVAPKGSMPYSSAGLYTLRYRDPTYVTAANLIVIRSGPLCTADASNPKSVKLNCSVVFAESPVQPNYPVFKWIGSNGNQVKQDQPIPAQINTFLKRSTSLLPITSTDTQTYQCQMTFSAAPKAPFVYTELRPPNFKASCSVSRA